VPRPDRREPMSPSTRQDQDLGQARGYTPGRTLPLRVEALRQLKRRRTAVMFGLLLALPWVLVVAFQFGPQRGGANSLRISDLATQGGLNFAAFALSVSANFLLV